MTLVVARLLGSSAVVVGDTHLTHEMTKKPVSVWEGMSKSTLLAADVCLSFAGNSDTAMKALEALPDFTAEDRTDALKAHFLRWHRQSEQATDFILAFHNGVEPDEIVQIKDGEAVSTKQAWIGSYAAFNVFRGYMEGADPQPGLPFDVVEWGPNQIPDNDDFVIGDNDLFNRLISAMERVVSSPDVPEVGGFAIAVAPQKNAFMYIGYARVHVPEATLATMQGTGPIPFGSVEEGGYAFGLVGSGFAGGKQWIAVYMVQGRKGLIFRPDHSRILRPTVIGDVSPIEFEEIARNRFGLEIGTWFTSASEIHVRAMRLIRDGNTQGALRLAERAVREGPRHAESFVCAGEVYRAVGRYRDAIGHFTTALGMSTDRHHLLFNKRGMAHLKGGDAERALADLTSAIEAMPAFFDAYANRAKLRFELRQFLPALADIDKGLEIRPDDVSLLQGKAAVLSALGRLDAAKDAIDRVLAMDPESESALQNRDALLAMIAARDQRSA